MATANPLAGIHAAIVTPVGSDGAIDLGRWMALAHDLLADGGCHGIGVFGTTGEATSFAVAERCHALEGLLRSGVAPDRTIVGIGSCAIADTLALARHALAQGCTRLLALPPFYYKNVSDEGLFRAYAELIERVADSRLELLLYHFPQLTGVPLKAALIERLSAAFPTTLRGIKDSSGDLDHGLSLIRTFPDLAVFLGADQYLLEALDAGGAGTISSLANVTGHVSRRVNDAFQSSDSGAATTAQADLTAIRKIVETRPVVPAVKHVVAALRADPCWRRLRPPLVELPEG